MLQNTVSGDVLPLENMGFSLPNRKKKNQVWLFYILDGRLSSEPLNKGTKSNFCFILKVDFSIKNFIWDQRKYFTLTEICLRYW